MLCADTSFLFSLYLRDIHSETAQARLAEAGQTLVLSSLNEYELGNALRLAEFRGLLPAGNTEHCLEALARDQPLGRWRPSEIPFHDIVAEAGRLSALHTASPACGPRPAGQAEAVPQFRRQPAPPRQGGGAALLKISSVARNPRSNSVSGTQSCRFILKNGN